MNPTRSLGFVVLADIIVFSHAHKRHGDSNEALAIANTRLRMLTSNIPQIFDAVEALRI
jgi:L-ascorbate metabolism protein UlaG (beta-lactamase superfamily)